MLRFLVLVGLLAACGVDEPADDQPDDPRWQAFVAARNDHLRALAVPISACVVRNDTGEAAFKGCIDWHSAVHGTFSLLAISRLLDDPQYAATANIVLDPAKVAIELSRLRAGAIDYEIPYGYSWFLVLARERARGGSDDLMPLAAEVQSQLEAWLYGLDMMSVQLSTLSAEYGNLSWVVVNLHAHAVFQGDTARAEALTNFARTQLLPLDQACPLWRDGTTASSFFPPCLHRLLALTRVLPKAESAAWLATYVPNPIPLTPLTMTTTAHSSGLDFSRAWGLYALWQATGNLDHLHLYLDHVETWMAHPEYWAQDYDNYSHWVAQFGVYAIASSYDDEPL